MKPIECSVNWYEKYANDPELQIIVDKLPRQEDLRYKHIDIGTTELWFAEKEGYVSFYAWNSPKQDKGFYGRHFDITLEDGSMVTLLGPWASRSGVMNKWFLPQCLEVSLKEEKNYNGVSWYSCSVTLEFALEAIKLCKEPIDLVVKYKYGEYIFIPQPTGKGKP
jgi:hypothetical protein